MSIKTRKPRTRFTPAQVSELIPIAKMKRGHLKDVCISTLAQKWGLRAHAINVKCNNMKKDLSLYTEEINNVVRTQELPFGNDTGKTPDSTPMRGTVTNVQTAASKAMAAVTAPTVVSSTVASVQKLNGRKILLPGGVIVDMETRTITGNIPTNGVTLDTTDENKFILSF